MVTKSACGAFRSAYDDADRVDFIRHRSGGSSEFLVLDYHYDTRARIDRITETEGGTTTEVDYTYDDRGRLTRDKRCTPNRTTPGRPPTSPLSLLQ